MATYSKGDALHRKENDRPNSPGSVRFNVRLYRKPNNSGFIGKVRRSDEPDTAKSVWFKDFRDLGQKMYVMMGKG